MKIPNRFIPEGHVVIGGDESRPDTMTDTDRDDPERGGDHDTHGCPKCDWGDELRSVDTDHGRVCEHCGGGFTGGVLDTLPEGFDNPG